MELSSVSSAPWAWSIVIGLIAFGSIGRKCSTITPVGAGVVRAARRCRRDDGGPNVRSAVNDSTCSRSTDRSGTTTRERPSGAASVWRVQP